MEEAAEHPANLFALLPQGILENMEDSPDICNVFTAFPELKCVCFLAEGTHFSWLIAQIMPLLAPKYLSFNDMFTCRLVSKRWKSAVDSTLENHPDRLPYQTIPSTIEEKMLISETHPNYQMLPRFEIKTELLRPCERRDQIMNSPEDRNPFIGRFLTFTIGEAVPYHLDILYSFFRPAAAALALALPLLQKFGKYIWYFKLTVYENYIRMLSTGEMIQFLAECLPYLPNLKSLIIAKKTPGMIWNPNRFDFPTALTISTKLELLDLTGLPRTNYNANYPLVSALLSNFGVGLKTLKINMADWNVQPVELLPALTHLQLNCTYDYPCGDNFYKLINRIFEQLKNPKLVKKLEVVGTQESIDMYRLLGVLAPYQIETLELQAVFTQVRNVDFTGPSTIQQLKIEFWASCEFNCTFLKQLPSLQFLCVDTTCSRVIPSTLKMQRRFHRLIEHDDQGWTLEWMLRVYCYSDTKDLSLMDFSIWDALPGLKMLSVESNGRISRRYFRECGNKIFLDDSRWRNILGSKGNLL